MPIRVTSRGPDPVGPKPFSQEWLTAPRDLSPGSLDNPPRRIPGEGVLAALVVLALVLVTIPWPDRIELATISPDDAIPAVSELRTPVLEGASGAATPGDPVAGENPETGDSALAAVSGSTPGVATTVEAGPAEDAILPGFRVLSYYGFPGVPNMGILGEYEMPELLEVLQDQATAYEQVDPSRPVKLAFEVIASVAQQWQQDDGSYLAYMGRDQLQEYVDFTAENDLLLILDMQFGRKTVQEEIDAVRKFLKYPHVHLALDPEFAINEGEVPGADLGQIDAADVQYALEELARISEEHDIPPKMLIVHQFKESSITNRESIVPVSGVQLVLEIDGFGAPEAKRATYELLTTGSTIEFYGFKLWYNLQDDPLMTPGEVLSLDPIPDLVIYQ